MSKKGVKTKAYIRLSLGNQDFETFKPDIFKFAADKGFLITDRDIIGEKTSARVHWKKRKLGSLVDCFETRDAPCP